VTFSKCLIVGAFKVITSLICRIDDTQLEKIPLSGPLIIYTNHVNILEIPIIYTRLQPRCVHGMLLAERWKNPILHWMLDKTETIPMHRGEADLFAIRKGLELLGKGDMIIISPEGTRSHDGRLAPAHPGAVLLALHSRAPLVPVAYFGAEKYAKNLRRLMRTDFHIRVGDPFRLDPGGEKITRAVREKMIEEMMLQLAALLPEQYRGVYAEPGTSMKHIISSVAHVTTQK
jgi:1-acyl-sn-glycerol-3-phosphate acyltransferase